MARADCITPIIKPNKPKALLIISMTKTFMNVEGSCASAKAAPEPVTPIAIPQIKLLKPTETPVQKMDIALNQFLRKKRISEKIICVPFLDFMFPNYRDFAHLPQWL